MHLFDIDVIFRGAHGIVGAQVALATGMGGSYYRKETVVTVLLPWGRSPVTRGPFMMSLKWRRCGISLIYVL